MENKSCSYLLKSHTFKNGEKNLITDVKGIKVGEYTIHDKSKKIHTGVTAIIPREDNIFDKKLIASAEVINGFGKTAGLVQLQELGSLETPIILTNTLSVGTALTALTKHMLSLNDSIGTTTGTVNCIVGECNDGRLNDIRGMHIKEEHVLEAISNADDTFSLGNHGAGSGMCCLGLKGGLGSSSKIVDIAGKTYTLGSLVVSNFGAAGHLRIDGNFIGSEILEKQKENQMKEDQGSIMIIIATDAPLTSRQLNRVCKRAAAALGRVGSYIGNGSGDIAIAFSTANTIYHDSKEINNMNFLAEDTLNNIFLATVESVEESIISSLLNAEEIRSGFCLESIDCLSNYISQGE